MISAPEAETKPAARPETAALVQAEEESHRRWPVSPATTLVVTLAGLLSVAAYLHFYPGGETIAYGDAKSHLLIARRVSWLTLLAQGSSGCGSRCRTS